MKCERHVFFAADDIPCPVCEDEAELTRLRAAHKTLVKDWTDLKIRSNRYREALDRMARDGCGCIDRDGYRCQDRSQDQDTWCWSCIADHTLNHK